MDIVHNWKISKYAVYYIGDTIYDIQAAKKANVFSIAITAGYHLKERLQKENPDLIVESLKELAEYFSKERFKTY